MKKFIAILMIAFAFLVTTNVAGASAASAAPAQVQTVSSVSVATALAPTGVGVGGVKPAWMYTSCYWNMNGAQYCWRYGCSFYERVVLGCYDGWYRTTMWYA